MKIIDYQVVEQASEANLASVVVQLQSTGWSRMKDPTFKNVNGVLTFLQAMVKFEEATS